MAIRNWALLCAAAGIDIRGLDAMVVYLLAGKILNDTQLTRAVVKNLVGSVAPMGLRAKILATWSDAERTALRERISGVVQIGNPRDGKHA
jgi:hypothetical protein